MSTERERWQISERLVSQFANRKDIHARQQDDGRYWLVNWPFTPGLMYLHLKGEVTLGTYLLNQESLAKFTVLDADDDVSGLQWIHADLTNQGIPSYLESSRRGGHLWFFFADRIAGEKARNFGLWFARKYGLNLEVYPKQEIIKGPGSLIRVPFGIHHKSGERYGFVGLGSLREQVETIADPQKVTLDVVRSHQYQNGSRVFHSPRRLQYVSLAEVVGQYVDLTPVASGYIGHCPFHDDETPSFGINTKGNYWHCFAGCGGGDVASFYMKIKNITYQEAARELEKMSSNGIAKE